MIKGFMFVNYLNESISVRLEEADPIHGLLITNVDGLGPVEGSVNKIDLASRHGSKYNSIKASDREITFTFRFTMANTIEDVRQLTYKYFPLSKPITVVCYTDNRTLMTNGYVSINDPEIWSEAEETEITICSEDPWLYKFTGGQITEFFGITPLFEFPFENNSLTEDLIEFGRIERKTERVLSYYGDAEVGVKIHIKFLNTVSDIFIYKIIDDVTETMTIYTEKMSAIVGSAIKNGDELIISTTKGDKYATYIRDGLAYNVLNAIDLYSDFFQIYKGDNIFMYNTDRVTNLEITITNEVAYEGI